MSTPVRSAVVLSILAILACGVASEPAPTHRVALPKTDSFPPTTITVPTLTQRPIALSSFKDKPDLGYTLLVGDNSATPGVFAATIRVERYEGLQLDCSGEWTTERRDALEVQTCDADNATTIVIPHSGGDIQCWSRWGVMGELTPVRRGLADAVDASCTTIAFE